MTRLARRTTLLVAFSLLASAATASAQPRTWTLWDSTIFFSAARPSWGRLPLWERSWPQTDSADASGAHDDGL